MYKIRNITEKDSSVLHYLAKRCYPLDVHTNYTYWVIAKYYGECSYIIEYNGVPVGYIISVDTPSVLFVWQIALLKEHRGNRLSAILIEAVVQCAKRLSKNLELTIAPDNASSYFSFNNYCLKNQIIFKEIGEVDIHDPDNPDFHEYEKKYTMIIS